MEQPKSSQPPAQKPRAFRLPTTVFGRSDVMRLSRELNSLTDYFAGAAAREAGSPQSAPPKTTRQLEQLAELNDLNLLDASHRQSLAKLLDQLVSKAPSIHMSFASEPTPKALEPIVVWLRDNIHPNCLLQTGIAPSIAAGAILRTPNKIFDMSLRVHLEKQAHLLNQLVGESIRAGSR